MKMNIIFWPPHKNEKYSSIICLSIADNLEMVCSVDDRSYYVT